MDAQQTQPSNNAGDSDSDSSYYDWIDELPNDSDYIPMRISDEAIEQSPRRFENPLSDNKCDIVKKEETTKILQRASMTLMKLTKKTKRRKILPRALLTLMKIIKKKR